MHIYLYIHVYILIYICIPLYISLSRTYNAYHTTITWQGFGIIAKSSFASTTTAPMLRSTPWRATSPAPRRSLTTPMQRFTAILKSLRSLNNPCISIWVVWNPKGPCRYLVYIFGTEKAMYVAQWHLDFSSDLKKMRLNLLRKPL